MYVAVWPSSFMNRLTFGHREMQYSVTKLRRCQAPFDLRIFPYDDERKSTAAHFEFNNFHVNPATKLCVPKSFTACADFGHRGNRDCGFLQCAPPWIRTMFTQENDEAFDIRAM